MNTCYIARRQAAASIEQQARELRRMTLRRLFQRAVVTPLRSLFAGHGTTRTA